MRRGEPISCANTTPSGAYRVARTSAVIRRLQCWVDIARPMRDSPGCSRRPPHRMNLLTPPRTCRADSECVKQAKRVAPTGLVGPQRPHNNDDLRDGAQHHRSGASDSGNDPGLSELADHIPPPDTLHLRSAVLEVSSGQVTLSRSPLRSRGTDAAPCGGRWPTMHLWATRPPAVAISRPVFVSESNKILTGHRCWPALLVRPVCPVSWAMVLASCPARRGLGGQAGGRAMGVPGGEAGALGRGSVRPQGVLAGRWSATYAAAAVSSSASSSRYSSTSTTTPALSTTTISPSSSTAVTTVSVAAAPEFVDEPVGGWEGSRAGL